MSIDRTEVIYVSNELKNIIENHKKAFSLYSSVASDDEYNDNNTLASLIKYLNDSIVSTQKKITKLTKKGIKDYEYDYLTQKREELSRKKKVIDEIGAILVKNITSPMIRELYEASPKNFDYNNFMRDCYKYREYNSKIRIFSIEELNALIKNNYICLEQTVDFEEGQIYIKHPFLPNTFIDINTTEGELFNEKMICLSKIAQLLGATELNGAAEFLDQQERDIDANGKLEYGESYLSFDEKKELAKIYKDKYHQKYKFKGIFIEGNWEKAKEEAKKYGLNKDKNIESLIDMRNPSSDNPLNSKSISIEMTREINQSIDLAFDLVVKKIKINPKYREIFKNRKTINYEFEIIF